MKKELTGLAKQDAFLTKIHSRPLHCPSCKGTHSYIELRGGNDWGKPAPNQKLNCPITGDLLEHKSSLIGSEYYLTN